MCELKLHASNQQEIYPPNSNDFAVTTDGAFTTRQIDAMERRTLHVRILLISPVPC